METLKLKLDEILNLSKESRAEIEKANYKLIHSSGASIEILEVQHDLVKVQVKNLNGHKIAKHKLLNDAYQILNRNLPSSYRISIKL